MKYLIIHKRIILLILVLVFTLSLLQYGITLYSTFYRPSAKDVTLVEGFTNVTDTNGVPLNTKDEYVILNVAHNKVLQTRSDNSIKSKFVDFSNPVIDDNMIFQIIDNGDNTQGIWNKGRKGVLGMDDANSRTYVKQPMETKSTLPSSWTWERFNIINYGPDNVVAIKSAFYKNRYYYLHSNGNTRVGQGGNWERMKFINYTAINRKRLDEYKKNNKRRQQIRDEYDDRRIAINILSRKRNENEINRKQYELDEAIVTHDNQTASNSVNTQSTIDVLKTEIGRLISNSY